MSNSAVRAAIEQMEIWLSDAGWEPEGQDLEDWNRNYQEAVAQAEKGAEWSGLVSRAQSLGKRLEQRLAVLVQRRDQIRAELDAQERGNRALAGYGASTR